MERKTYGEQFKEVLACDTQEQAAKWLAAEIDRYQKDLEVPAEEAKRVILINMGYMAGYYDDATAKKIHALFGADHPVFGSHDYHKTVTPEQAIEAGKKMAESL